MINFKPNLPFSVPAELQMVTEQKVKGVLTKTYTSVEGGIFISFKTYGGTESTSNGVTVIENTGVVQTWYREDIKPDCRLIISDVPYEIIGTPENINMSNQYLQFKVRAVKGGA